jgi:hypothetical protein
MSMGCYQYQWFAPAQRHRLNRQNHPLKYLTQNRRRHRLWMLWKKK